ncbi:hypothetical protein CFP65_6958 [Kitasatospora sp. MMS16-BH015]|uniref:hypothetical protein n=1 Tax=Kitasatospora sp. MMS16-BH015 TaxID=2018025 RepID=UPI000CA120CD|nr:hypothetical protein [Kitasatospora sp. MMS16-BH015]AUG81570.1 hypothetical protein CFP65_6958 [Kitasatospora sp. MMS16-BH015]
MSDSTRAIPKLRRIHRQFALPDPGGAAAFGVKSTPRSRSWRRSAALLLIALAVTTGCGSKVGSHPVSSEEAERLSAVRFGTGLAGGARFSALLSMGTGLHDELSGQVDWKGKVAEAKMTAKDADGVVHHYSVLWNDGTLATSDDDKERLEGKGKAWVTRPLAADRMLFDRVAHTLLAIASDRPDNPVLLASDGARWLRRDKVGDTAVDVFRGPGQRNGQQQPAATADVSPEFWVDGDGHLARFRAPLENGLFTADFSEWGSRQIADAAQLATPATSASPTTNPAAEQAAEGHSG